MREECINRFCGRCILLYYVDEEKEDEEIC